MDKSNSISLKLCDLLEAKYNEADKMYIKMLHCKYQRIENELKEKRKKIPSHFFKTKFSNWENEIENLENQLQEIRLKMEDVMAENE